MFLVNDSGTLVFCGKDPRSDGYAVETEVVMLEEEHNSSIWKRGSITEPVRVLGVNPNNPKHYRYFLSLENLQEDEFLVVVPVQQPHIVMTWDDYLASQQPFPQ